MKASTKSKKRRPTQLNSSASRTDRKVIAEVINRDDVRSRVVKDGARFDLYLGIALGTYFTSDERFDFNDLILERLSFDEKIRAIEQLPLKKAYKSVAALPVIRHVQQVRNLMAHSWATVDHHHRKLINANWLYLFSDYPTSYEEPVTLAKRRLWRLMGTKEFERLWTSSPDLSDAFESPNYS